MAEKELETAQRALRRLDYDPMSDSEDDARVFDPFSMTASASSIRQRGRASESQNGTVPSVFDNIEPSFDTFHRKSDATNAPSLFDTPSYDDGSIISTRQPQNSSLSVPGAAGYLEMEEEPPRPNITATEPIKTDSGLLLTHRQSPTVRMPRPSEPIRNANFSFRNAQNDYFEMEHDYAGWGASSRSGGRNSMLVVQARRLMSYVKIWVVISAVLLIAATSVLLHSYGHSNQAEENKTATAYQQMILDYQQSKQQIVALDGDNNSNNAFGDQEKVILLPIEAFDHGEEVEDPPRRLGHHRGDKHSSHEQHNGRRHLMDLRDEFERWLLHHGKSYHSQDEKERRFHIWSNNHHKTIEKNRRHGPCRMSKQPVFGSNHFKDLTPDEFKTMYLTGYKGPKTDELERMTPNARKLSKDSGKVLNPNGRLNMHESVRNKIKMKREAKGRALQQQPVMAASSSGPNCKWYDFSCLLRWLWQSAGVQFGTVIGTMEPMYDADAFPNAVDWREDGAVTSVRSQGDCGACWAITAVETVESAHYIATGNLYDLSEAEIIACDDSCEMCSGGWPQNAFEWTMDHGGLLLYNSFPYDGTSLLAMTMGIEGTSDSWTEDMVQEYRQEVCPEDNSGSASKDSNDMEYYDQGRENGNYGDYSDQGRYGNIKGYGYATDRCICYSDGSGCDCEEQNEGMAVRNLATYGPAVVCLEASLWQDYTGGIITSDSGCGSAFLDMNHCVQVVGYAFNDGSDEDEGADGSGSGSGSKSGSQDDSKREGYWIVRNQWGNYWGMNGYAYVAMGDNTCGILNDMTQAYL